MSKHLEQLYKNKKPLAVHGFDHLVIFDYTYGVDDYVVTAFINPITTEYEDFRRVKIYYTQTTQDSYFQRYKQKYYIKDFILCKMFGGEL